MYKELASLIYDNYFLINYSKAIEKYLLVARPDEDDIVELIDERTNNKET